MNGYDVGDLLICDVEMPQIDGFHLTKLIKQHPELNKIPVLLYSSIITPDNHKKGKAVGADAQVSKPELSKVVELADHLIAS
ncbi:MAG: response regulator, partial [Dehalococcoidia bacterium]|nr:response regulator [Dehalococcoidia bacterium]